GVGEKCSLVLYVDCGRVEDVRGSDQDGAMAVDAGVVDEDVDDLAASGEWDLVVGDRVVDVELDAPSTFGEQAVPAVLSLGEEGLDGSDCARQSIGRCTGQIEDVLHGLLEFGCPLEGLAERAMGRVRRLGLCGLQGEAQAGEWGSQLMGGVGGEVPCAA